MNTISSRLLVCVEPLADRNRNPSALLLDFGAHAAGQPLLGHPDFLALAARFPCLALDSVAPPLAEALLRAGGRLIPQESLGRTDCLPGPDLPDSVQWIAGNWYLAPPGRITGCQAASRALALQLVQLVSADADTHEIEAVLRRDPALSYHLLRLVNSLGMGLSKKISSFSQAILILGRAQLRRWLNLMLFSSRQGDARCAMLLARVAARARLMELLARAGGLDKAGQDQAFMAGMFSLLGILFGMPLAELLKPLRISDALCAALLEHQGELGRLLALAEAAERRDRVAAADLLDAIALPCAEFNLLAIQANGWMLDVIRESCGGADA